MEASPLLQRDAATVPSLPTYAKTRDSGVEWLGDVPAHWEVVTLRQLLRPVAEKNRADLPLLSVVREKGVVLRDTADRSANHNYIPDNLTNYKVVKRGQLAVNKMKAWQGSYGVSPRDGIVSPAYFVFQLRVRRNDQETPQNAFLHNAIRSSAYVPFFARESDGVRIGQWDLSAPRMKGIPFLLPPLAEQAAIVRFLDYVDRCSRRAVRQKEKLIALLEEQQQAIVQQAVTGQIDVQTCQPYPAYRESEVQWLTKVPAHWPELALGTASKSIQTGPFGSQLHANEYVDDGVPVINPSHLSEGRIAPDHSVAVTERKAAELSRHRLAPGDVVMARRGEVGRSALVRSPEAGWICGTGSLRLRPRKTACSPDYLLLVLNSSGARDALELASVGSTMSNLNAEIVSRLRIFLPPLPEQNAIAEFCRKATDRHTAATDRTRRQIALLREFRTRLTADVVTGKLDVRDAAAAMPEGDPLADDPA